MNQRNKNLSIEGLRWVLGLVILLESVRFALSSSAAHEVARIGLPEWLPVALGGTEAVAALLFLTPAALAGGYALLSSLQSPQPFMFFMASMMSPRWPFMRWA